MPPLVQSFALAACRTAGLLAPSAVPLGGALPGPLRLALLIVLTVTAVAASPLRAPASTATELASYCALELALGVLMGLPFRLVLEAVRHAGEVFARSLPGFEVEGPSFLDGCEPASLPGRVAALTAVAVALGVGVDRELVGALVTSPGNAAGWELLSQEALGETCRALGALYFRVALLGVLPLLALTVTLEGAARLAERAGLAASGPVLAAARSAIVLLLLGASVTATFAPAAGEGFSLAAAAFLPGGGR